MQLGAGQVGLLERGSKSGGVAFTVLWCGFGGSGWMIWTMGKKKACKNLFQIDLRKERSPYMDADPSSWTADSMTMRGVEKLLPVGFSLQPLDQPRVGRVDSYRAPPLKLTLETIVEDKPEFYLRSKSLPVQRRFSMDSAGHGLHRLPSYRPGQGEYLSGGCGVSMSGPILSSSYDYDSAPKHRSRISKMREALRNGRLRQAFSSFLARMRPASRRSH
ncbi:hypothetical protein M758_4G050300 [Ceratodon purpureus]|nr:hypothetical protein M758_4G050300 [Ceratodon purpureus]